MFTIATGRRLVPILYIILVSTAARHLPCLSSIYVSCLTCIPSKGSAHAKLSFEFATIFNFQESAADQACSHPRALGTPTSPSPPSSSSVELPYEKSDDEFGRLQMMPPSLFSSGPTKLMSKMSRALSSKDAMEQTPERTVRPHKQTKQEVDRELCVRAVSLWASGPTGGYRLLRRRGSVRTDIPLSRRESYS